MRGLVADERTGYLSLNNTFSFADVLDHPTESEVMFGRTRRGKLESSEMRGYLVGKILCCQ